MKMVFLFQSQAIEDDEVIEMMKLKSKPKPVFVESPG